MSENLRFLLLKNYFICVKICINLLLNINRSQSQQKSTHSDKKYAYVTDYHAHYRGNDVESTTVFRDRV